MYALDDYYFFYLVVKYGGFSAASEATQITKSKLSRRILALEQRFNIILIQRSTRHFKVTTVGQLFFQHCEKMIQQVEEADQILLQQQIEPQGLIKISCPHMMMQFQIRHLISQFLKTYPKVHIELELTSRRVDLLHDDIDLAIRTNFHNNEDSNLIVRDVVKTRHCLVASPELLQGHEINDFTQLYDFPSIVLSSQQTQYCWKLKHQYHAHNIEIPLQPRIKSNDLAGVYYAVKDGLGIADLPYLTVEEDLKNGQLIHLLPEWSANVGTVQLVYASRKGQRLVMQQLIDYLVENLRNFAHEQPTSYQI